MSTIASQITSLTIVYSTIYSGADQSKHQSSAPLAFVWGIQRGPVNSPHKWPVTRKMFPFDDVIMRKYPLHLHYDQCQCHAWQAVICVQRSHITLKRCAILSILGTKSPPTIILRCRMCKLVASDWRPFASVKWYTIGLLGGKFITLNGILNQISARKCWMEIKCIPCGKYHWNCHFYFRPPMQHYTDVMMTTMVPQITRLTVVYSIVYSGADQRKHQSSASLAFVRGIHRDRWIPRTKGQ